MQVWPFLIVLSYVVLFLLHLQICKRTWDHGFSKGYERAVNDIKKELNQCG